MDFHSNGDPYQIMKTVVTGKQIDVGDALRTHVEERLRSGLSKYFDDDKLQATVTFSREGSMFRADCRIHAGHDTYLQSHCDAPDIYAAFEATAERIEKRLRRFKRRLTNHHKRAARAEVQPWKAASYVLAPSAEEESGEEIVHEADGQPVIVAETVMDIPELSVGEAVMRMDLAETPAMVFRNRNSGQFNVVYRRGDGNVGWVDPANGNTGT